jgi:hypothetical protein
MLSCHSVTLSPSTATGPTRLAACLRTDSRRRRHVLRGKSARDWHGGPESATRIGSAFPFVVLPMRVGRDKICDGIHWKKGLASRVHRSKISITWDYGKEYNHIRPDFIKYQRLRSQVRQSLLSATKRRSITIKVFRGKLTGPSERRGLISHWKRAGLLISSWV